MQRGPRRCGIFMRCAPCRIANRRVETGIPGKCAPDSGSVGTAMDTWQCARSCGGRLSLHVVGGTCAIARKMFHSSSFIGAMEASVEERGTSVLVRVVEPEDSVSGEVRRWRASSAWRRSVRDLLNHTLCFEDPLGIGVWNLIIIMPCEAIPWRCKAMPRHAWRCHAMMP